MISRHSLIKAEEHHTHAPLLLTLCRLLPPQHKNARSKYVPVKSLAYGCVKSTSYTSNGSNCGSVCRVESVGDANVRDDKGILSSSGVENKAWRCSASAPSSPSSACKRRDISLLCIGWRFQIRKGLDTLFTSTY